MFFKNIRRVLDSKPRMLFVEQIIFATTFSLLTGGVFLSGLAVLMGASDVLISYISVIANICGVLILIFATFLERFSSKKKLTIAFTITSKATTLFIVFIPLLIESQFQIFVFIPTIIIAFTLQALTTVCLNNWLAHFTPNDKRGIYISIRQTSSLVVTVALSLVAGKLMDSMTNQYFGFIILFATAFIMAIIEIIILSRIDDVCVNPTTKVKYNVLDIFKIPLSNKPFIRYVCYIALFYLILYISDSFTVVYMLKYLDLPYTTIVAMQSLISIPQLFMLGIWGWLSDKYGHNFVLFVSIWFFVGETLFLALSNPSNLYMCIPIAFFIASIANSGFVVAVFNRRYEIVPEKGRMIYDSFYSAAIGVSFILGPFVGGLFKNLFSNITFLQQSFKFADIRLLYVISAVGILIIQLLYVLTKKKKRCKCKHIKKL